MASPVPVVKDEPGGDDVFHAPTDSEAEDIDNDNLQPLAPKFASQSKFPVGCKVWYNLRLSPETKHIQAKSGSVEEVYIHFENGRRVYKVKAEASYDHKTTLYEDQLVYAISCPVKVTKVDSIDTLEGIVVYLERQKGSDGKRQVTYAVQYLVENYVSIEPGVTADRIKYRAEDCGVRVGGKENNTSIEKQTNCIQEGDTYKEEKGVEELSHSSSVESFAPVDSNDGNDFNRSNSLDTARWEPPSPLQRKRSSGSESNANRRPTKQAKREVGSEVRGEVKRDASIGNTENTAAVRTLTIPSWWVSQWGKENRRQLYSHLIGKAKSIKSSTNCSIQISGHDTDERMRITIKSLSKNFSSKLNGIMNANRTIERSLVEYLADENSEKRLLYDLAVSAIDSCQQLTQRDSTSGLLRKEIFDSRASKQWWRLFELPCEQGMHHGLFLRELKLPTGSDCKIEVFERSVKVPLAPPYVLVSGTKHVDVKNAAIMVADTMRKHQRFCPCRPRW